MKTEAVDGTAGDRPRRTSEATKAAILAAARSRFAEQGYERTTIRGVAADAGIDASMVMRYFGSKEQLFEAALAIDLHLPDVRDVPPDRVPALFIRHFLDRWEGDPTDDALLVLLRSAVTNDQAAARMRDIFARQVAPAVAAALPPGPDAPARAALVSAQLLGLALTRYLLRLPPALALTPEQIEELYAPALTAVLTSR
ncbi:TetR/AcrR family transcriptional regulator [Actinacidiphila acidipaludis]|uniref:TetR family transcriptional regulator n=1 Tax=Actinacidiphila acidipaludis TaxID=2873382 RepID=A0ABS7Q6Q7_9ACTN|nr:TetR family transcriptional regulator [Streptomyces acidipaludis]MBY8878419.1 TetR family transcriptional regulator [Streptomyces acidipaludis]